MNLSLWSQGDLISYFQSTFIGIKEEGTIQPLLISNVVELPGNKQAFTGSIGRREVAIPLDSDTISIVVPESSFINTEHQAVYCSRKTERQYKKGIRETQFRNIGISRSDCSNREVGNILPRASFREDIVQGLIDPIFPSFGQAVGLLKQGEMVSCAFHKHFALQLKPDIEDIVLNYKGMMCGKVVEGKVELLNDFSALYEKLIEIVGV